jgi:aminocarboxymuconate-semialdehyde decarboxylase
MPIIDTHAHFTPEEFERTIAAGQTWHGLDGHAGRLQMGGFGRSVEARLADMDADGIDMQLVSPTIGFYQYANDPEVTAAIARDCNDAVAALVTRHPDRFLGLGTLPMQSIPLAIAELERVMTTLEMKGVMIDDHVNGATYDLPEFLPFFQAAERLGALVFFHQGDDTCVKARNPRHKLPNAIGNLTDRTITFASLVCGGVMDACPNLRVLLGHGGGYVAFGIARLDKIAGALEGDYESTGLVPPFGRNDREPWSITKPPSSYLSRFYYDCCTYDGPALRFLIDKVGIDQVVLGTDYPAPMLLLDSVRWVNGLPELTSDEKTAVLSGNASKLLGV